VEVLDWTAAALNRVQRPAFFEKFLETHAVQYFYEPFLEAFDPELRKELGVWYTPPEIVQYQVARVDAVLREELDIPDGLADPRVHVLDLCCGTGAYLVEVLRRIVKTLTEEKGESGAALALAKDAAMRRVYGFEIMPAPFVVAHLQIGLLLQNLGVSLKEAQGERAGIFLTNSLTGWDFAGENPQLKNWPELEAERVGAGKVKQDAKILVILGNPPYNAYAGISPEEEQGLVEPYKQGLIAEWGIKKFNLDDLYIRFFRIAERKIAERTGQGIISFISNHSWISDPSFVVMRKHLLTSFDKVWIENLHGNRKISEYAPDGRTSETIFALQGFSPGIQQGVATSLLLRTGKKRKPAVLFRDDLSAARAAERRVELVASLKSKKFDFQYEKANPTPLNRFSFRPADVASHYLHWPKLVEICAVPPSNGLMEKRGGALMAFGRQTLEMRMRDYFDPHVTWEQLQFLETSLTVNAAGFDARSRCVSKCKLLTSSSQVVCAATRCGLLTLVGAIIAA
jgi:predicted helicase